MPRPSLALVLWCALGATRADAAPDPTALERGVAEFSAGHFAAAVPWLERALAAEPGDADTSLLLGIAYVRTGQAARADALLRHVEAVGDDEARATARLFLGLAAAERGDQREARAYYAAVASSATRLGGTGRMLLEGNATERWSVALVARGEADSNVPVAAGAISPGAKAADGAISLQLAASARPIADLPIVVDETLGLRRHAQLSSYDTLSSSLGITVSCADPCQRASLSYHFEASMQGGDLYALGHVVDATYRREAAASTAIVAGYTLALRDYSLSGYEGYTGDTHAGSVEIAWRAAPRLDLRAGAVAVLDRTDDPSLRAIGGGGRANARVGLGGGAEIRTSLEVTARTYRETASRDDVRTFGDVSLYVDLTPAIGLVIGGAVLRNASTDPGFDLVKWTGFAALVLGESE